MQLINALAKVNLAWPHGRVQICVWLGPRAEDVCLCWSAAAEVERERGAFDYNQLEWILCIMYINSLSCAITAQPALYRFAAPFAPLHSLSSSFVVCLLLQSERARAAHPTKRPPHSHSLAGGHARSAKCTTQNERAEPTRRAFIAD